MNSRALPLPVWDSHCESYWISDIFVCKWLLSIQIPLKIRLKQNGCSRTITWPSTIDLEYISWTQNVFDHLDWVYSWLWTLLLFISQQKLLINKIYFLQCRLWKIKMKISAILVAATQAAPSSMHQWIVDNWRATAEETFNYATPNWEKFRAAVDRVSKGQIISHYSARINLVNFQQWL